MKLTVSECKIRVWVLNGSWRQVRNCQILLAQETVVLVVVRRSRRQKTIKLKLVKQCRVEASEIKPLRFEMFLKWRHSAPIFHFAVIFIGRGQSEKFKAWFHGEKALEFSFFGLNTFLDAIEIPNHKNPVGRILASWKNQETQDSEMKLRIQDIRTIVWVYRK